MKERPSPAILMGDLNTMADHPMIKKILANPEVIDARAYLPEGRERHVQVDCIFLRGFEVIESQAWRRKVSDHFILWSQVRFAGKKTKAEKMKTNQTKTKAVRPPK